MSYINTTILNIKLYIADLMDIRKTFEFSWSRYIVKQT